MALRGDLKDFSLPDVFQLVQLSGKTGVLRIARPGAEGSIWFRAGDVFFAQSNWRREMLGARLVGAQRITPAALARALELRAAEGEGGRRLGEILVGEGYITQQVLETFVREQIQDTIFDLMRWDEGTFDFEVLPAVVNEDIGLSVSVENIVMEGSRRLEEWQRIKKKVPSTDMVFKMSTAPGEGTLEISLRPIEWALLLLIDGTRSVRELAVQTHATDFDIARVVYGLYSAGLLDVPSDEEIELLRADRARRDAARAALDADEAVMQEEPIVSEVAAAEAPAQPAAPSVRLVPEVVLGSEPAVVASALEVARPAPEEPEFLGVGAETGGLQDGVALEEMMVSVLAPEAIGGAPAVLDQVAEIEDEIGALKGEPAAAREVEPETEPTPWLAPEPESEMTLDWQTSWPQGVAVEPLAEVQTEEPVETKSNAQPDAAVGSQFAAQPEAAVGSQSEEQPGAAVGLHTEVRLAAAPEPSSELLPGSELEPQPIPEPETAGVPSAPEFSAEVEFARRIDLIVSDLSVSTTAIDEIGPAVTPLAQNDLESEAPSTSGDYEADLRALGLGEYPEELLRQEESWASPEPVPVPEVQGIGLGPGADGAGHARSEGVTTGVISTDAFMAEFDDGSGLSGGLGDELTALTGGASVRSRPTATVAKLPQPHEAHLLRRDLMIDRELLEKIIRGVEDL